MTVNASMEHIPRALLEEWVDYIVFRCASPEPLRALNERFRDDPASRSNPDIDHWLNLYGDEIDATNLFTTSIVQSALESENAVSQDSGITPEFVQKQFMRVFTAVLWNDGPLYQNLHSLVQDFLKHHCLVRAWWKPHGTTIIGTMIAKVDRIRTKEWQRNPKRIPSTLPDTFSWRLLLLDCAWPDNNDTADDREKKCKHFADQLAIIVDKTVVQDDAVTKVLYHKRLDELNKFLKWYITSTSQANRPKLAPLHTERMNNGLLTAIQLGHIAKTGASSITTSDMLKVNIAIYLVSIIGGFHKVEKDLKTRFELLLDNWKVCENEDIRRDAYELVAKYNLSESESRNLLEESRLQLEALAPPPGFRALGPGGCPDEDLIDYSDEDVHEDEDVEMM